VRKRPLSYTGVTEGLDNYRKGLSALTDHLNDTDADHEDDDGDNVVLHAGEQRGGVGDGTREVGVNGGARRGGEEQREDGGTKEAIAGVLEQFHVRFAQTVGAV